MSREFERPEALVKKTFTPIFRDIAKRALSPVYPNEILTASHENGMFKFESRLMHGDGGIICFRHFSLDDPPRIVLSMGSASEIISEREVVMAGARHQVYPGVAEILNFFEMRLHKIVTRNTIRRAREKNKPLPKFNEGGEEFLQDALSTVARGGILMIAPEGERRKTLDLYRSKTIGRIIEAAKQQGVENISFLFVDLRVAGMKEGYWDKNGFNLFRKYEIRIGNSLTLAEVMEQANGDWSNVDKMVILPQMQKAAEIHREV